MRSLVLGAATLMLLCHGFVASAQKNTNGWNPLINKNVVINQLLDSQTPLDDTFRDENNREVKFGDYLGKRPAILVMPFYRCAGACTLELDGLAKALNTIRFDAGKEYDVIVVSIDPSETYTLAQAKKRDYMDLYQRPGGDKGWHFLTGTDASIQRLATSVGYHYTQDPRTGRLSHPVGLIYLTPQGRVSHYLFGVDYSPRDMTLALVDASSSKIGSLSEYAALLCTHSDPTGKYTVAINKVLRLAGGGTVLILALFIGALFRMERKRTAQQTAEPHGNQIPDELERNQRGSDG